jgi:DNA modification methylase
LAAAVAAVLRGDRPGIMVTDPPYGVEYDAAWRNEAGIAATKQTGRVHNDDRASWAAAFRHFPGDVAYVWHAGRFASAVERSLVVLGFEIRAQIVWVKRRFAISRGHYHWRHEPCWYAVRRGASARWAGGRKQSTAWADIVDAFPQPDLFACPVDEATVLAFDGSATTVWEIPGDRAVGGGHSTQKPVECMARPIRNHDVAMVYEPFSGSGTTTIACERLGKACRALEISPGYVAVALQRWADATGGTPELVKS